MTTDDKNNQFPFHFLHENEREIMSAKKFNLTLDLCFGCWFLNAHSDLPQNDTNALDEIR
mgnify:CR=1 FL=1